MNNDEIRFEIRERKYKLERIRRQIAQLGKQIQTLRAEKKRVQDEIYNLATLPPKLQEAEAILDSLSQPQELPLNQWRGRCSCGITLTSNDMPFTDKCPYCKGQIPYETSGGNSNEQE